MKKNILSFLVLFIISLVIRGQNSQLRSFSIEDGLPQSQVYDIIQDPTGYLWLGTQGGGLSNFNGTDFTVFKENDGLLSNYIHALCHFNDSLFIGTNRGLSIKIKNTFVNFESPEIHDFFSAENSLYIGTKKGVYSFSTAKKLSKLTFNKEIDNSVVNKFLFDGEFYWIATNNGLWKIDRLQEGEKNIEKISNYDYTDIVYKDHKIFATTFNNGVLILDTVNNGDDVFLYQKYRVNSLSIHHDNELWLATDNVGIIVLDMNTFSEIRSIDKSKGLAVSHIRKTYTDKQANIWIATSGGGFYKYFQNNFQHFDAVSGLKGNRVYAVHNANHSMWISSSEAGLTKIDSMGIHHIPPIKGFADVKIKTITSDENEIWAGSDGKGVLYRITKEIDSIAIDRSDSLHIVTSKIAKSVTKNYILNEKNKFPSNWVRKLVKGTDGCWAATYSSGIVDFKYDTEKDSLIIKKIYGNKEGLQHLLITDISLDSKDRLWYSTKSGNLGYLENGAHISLGLVLKEKINIRTLLFYEDKLFVGTAGKGIWAADLADDTLNFNPIKGLKKMSSKNIYQLIFDDEGYLWAGTEKGVDKIQLNHKNDIEDIYHFGRNDGFLGIETCLNAVDKDEEGNLWFGALYGLTKYTPNTENKKSVPPEVFFEDVQVAYISIDTINLKKWTNTSKILRLNPEQTQLSFSYKSIDLDHPNQIEYRTKLNNNEWSPWSKENKQNFAGLTYGNHQFFVQSRNYRWEQSSVIKFNFFIDSPLYKKIWFQWVVIAFGLLVLLIVVSLYIRKIRRKNKADKEALEVQNHLLSLEHKALQLQMNPHFIFNVLNGIKAMAIDKPEKMNTTINSFAVLLRDTLNNSRKEHVTLAQEIRTLQHYITLEQLMTTKVFSFSIENNCHLDAEEILIPPMLVQPFVENAIRHGILKNIKEGDLKIVFTNTEDYLECLIQDNGVGIFKSQAAKKKTDHQSMALTVTKERLLSLSEKNTLNISEIKNNDDTIGGTKIIFKIPLLTDY